ncbi:MAG: hypothetical protein AAFZ52_05765 [Bacteroidota bacterium]
MSDREVLDQFALPGAFALYQRFNRREDMLRVMAILQEYEIEVRTSEFGTKEWREDVIMGSPLEPRYWIEIPANRFEHANYFLQEAAAAELEEADLHEHPFAEYTTKELRQVLLEESEWSPDAVVIARQLLLRRDENVDLAGLRRAAGERLAAAFAPRRGNIVYIFSTAAFGVFSGLILWFIGIMFALGILLYYRIGSRLDPKGRRHWAYVDGTRAAALVGLLLLGGSIVLGFINFFYLQLGPVAELDVWLWWWR